MKETPHIFQLDPDDHSRIVCFWRNLSDFSDTIKAFTVIDKLEEEFYWTTEEAYYEQFGRPDDGLQLFFTRDPRFCVSKRHQGLVYKYGPNGQYVGEVPLQDFIKAGHSHRAVGRHQPLYGYKGLSLGAPWIWLMDSMDGHFWSFLKRDKIPVMLIRDQEMADLGEEMYNKFVTGELPRINPYTSVRLKTTREKHTKKQIENETEEI
jgi:hypothetical protein